MREQNICTHIYKYKMYYLAQRRETISACYIMNTNKKKGAHLLVYRGFLWAMTASRLCLLHGRALSSYLLKYLLAGLWVIVVLFCTYEPSIGLSTYIFSRDQERKGVSSQGAYSLGGKIVDTQMMKQIFILLHAWKCNNWKVRGAAEWVVGEGAKPSLRLRRAFLGKITIYYYNPDHLTSQSGPYLSFLRWSREACCVILLTVGQLNCCQIADVLVLLKDWNVATASFVVQHTSKSYPW